MSKLITYVRPALWNLNKADFVPYQAGKTQQNKNQETEKQKPNTFSSLDMGSLPKYLPYGLPT